MHLTVAFGLFTWSRRNEDSYPQQTAQSVEDTKHLHQLHGRGGRRRQATEDHELGG